MATVAHPSAHAPASAAAAGPPPTVSTDAPVGHLQEEEVGELTPRGAAKGGVETTAHKRQMTEEEKVSVEEQTKKQKAEMIPVTLAQRAPAPVVPYEIPGDFFKTLMSIRAETFAIEGIPSQTPILVCNREDSVVKVYKGLIEKNISAVPVMLKDSDKYYGFITLMDIVRYIVSHFGAEKFSEEKEFWTMVEEEKDFAKKTVNDLMQSPRSVKNPYHPLIAGYSGLAILEAMVKEKGVHRIPIISTREERKILNLVTESQVIRWLDQNKDLLGDRAKKPITAALGGTLIKNVISVKEHQPAMEAFELMVTHDIQGVAIVNEEGRLKGNISLKDLKLIGSDAFLFWRLHQSVQNFVRKLRKEFQSRHGRPRSAIYLLPSATINDVITQCALHNIHRIYVCNTHHDKTPIGVVSMQDILLECCTPY